VPDITIKKRKFETDYTDELLIFEGKQTAAEQVTTIQVSEPVKKIGSSLLMQNKFKQISRPL
jgi:hypothetical protein